MSVNLRLKSEYNFLSSTLTINKIISLSKKHNYQVASICDNNTMFGAYQFYLSCLKEKIKPLIGVEYNVIYNQTNLTLLLFATNEKGYYNLVKLTSLVNKYNQKELSLDDILNNSDNLLCIIPSDNECFINQESKDIEIYFKELQKKFIDNLYLGVFRYPTINLENLNKLTKISSTLNIKKIAMQTTTHQSREDTLILNLLDCIKNQSKANRDFLSNPAILNSYFKSQQELQEIYLPDELSNLNEFINKINISISKIEYDLPKLVENSNKELRNITHSKLKEFNLDNTTYQTRLEYELKVIEQMGFSDYFFIVSDYVNYAKTHDIMVGPARGSAGGSLVSYLLNITTIDPLQYNLIFERFLNPQRISMPDIDIDFLDIKRDEVIEYVKEKYGYRKVSHIVTFSTLGPKSSIRDMARVLSIPTNEVDYLLSFYSNEHGSIKEAYEKNKKFREVVDIHKNYKQLISLASHIEGLKRQSGIHAAGIVLHNREIDELIPTFEDQENDLVTMYDYVLIEKLGLLKMDFLGLKNLTIVDACLKQINHLDKTNLSLDTYQYDSDDVYKYLSRGDTLGVFQLESDGMKKTLVKLKPTCFNDIVSLLALYRPGPMKNIDSFINRKYQREEIKYIHPFLKDILDETYGIIVYQEQIMSIVQKLASFTMAEADIFRKAITKKVASTLASQKDKFIKGCLNNEISQSKAIEIYELIEAFAEYGFNKAHSVGYAKLAVIMASIKYRYPLVFYTTLLNTSLESESKKVAIFNEARSLNIKPLFPSVNYSTYYFTIKEKNILFGLNSINSINNKIAEMIISEREKGLFSDIFDFFIRMIKKDLNITAFESLIYSGALDEFLISRPILIYNLKTLYNYGEMFKNLPYDVDDYKTYSYLPTPILEDSIDNLDIDFLKKEKEMLGIYLSNHPLCKLKEQHQNITNINDLTNKTQACLIGYVNTTYIGKNKNKNDYLSINLEDETGEIRLLYYNNITPELKNSKNKVVKVFISIKDNNFYVASKIEILNGGK